MPPSQICSVCAHDSVVTRPKDKVIEVSVAASIDETTADDDGAFRVVGTA